MNMPLFSYLKRLQKHMWRDLLALRKEVAWTSLSYVIMSASALLTSIVLARYIPQDTFGTYKYIISFAPLVSVFSLTGIPSALLQAVAKGKHGTIRFLAKKHIVSAVLLSILLLTIAGYYIFQGNNILGFSLAIIAVTYPYSLTAGLYKSIILGNEQYKQHTYYFLFFRVAHALAIILAALYTTNIIVLVSSYFITDLLSNSLLLFLTWRKYPTRGAVDSKAFSLAKHLSAINIFSIAAKHIDKILVFQYLGPVELAIYTFAILPPEQIDGVVRTSARRISLPKLSKVSTSLIREKLLKKVFRLYPLLPLIAIAYILCAPFIYQFFFPEYIVSTFFSQVAILTVLFIPNVIMSQVYIAHYKKKQLYILETIFPTLHIILLFILLPLMGIIGAIISKIVVQFFIMIAHLYFIRKI